MDPSDLRAGLADRLAGSAPIDAETFNAACFMLSRSLDELSEHARERREDRLMALLRTLVPEYSRIAAPPARAAGSEP